MNAEMLSTCSSVCNLQYSGYLQEVHKNRTATQSKQHLSTNWGITKMTKLEGELANLQVVRFSKSWLNHDDKPAPFRFYCMGNHIF